MKLLLDTHALLWWSANDPRLSVVARNAITDPATMVLVSSASAWEISTKARIGKLHGVQRLLSSFDQLLAADQFTALPVNNQHALLAGQFDYEHRDPFDRMLAAQAIIEGAGLITIDQAFTGFGVSIIW
jgi:PIN domain nuclease of toxin-antitoxin system